MAKIGARAKTYKPKSKAYLGPRSEKRSQAETIALYAARPKCPRPKCGNTSTPMSKIGLCLTCQALDREKEIRR